jgi:hypothetical protein
MAYFADNPNCPSNFLSGIGFQFNLEKLPGVSFYCQSANVPSQNLAVATQATRFNAIPEPGDEVNYDDLTIRFLVDEDLKNYMSIHNWIRYLGHPEGENDWNEYSDGESYQEKQYSDGFIFILDSNFNRKFRIYFKDLFPVSLSGLNFDATYTDTEYFAVDATFKFTIFDIEEVGSAPPFTATYDPPTISLSSSLDANNNTILTWTSENADAVNIDRGVGKVATSGTTTSTYSVSTAGTTITFTATAVGRGGTISSSTSVAIPAVPLPQQTTTNRLCIAIIDESSSQSVSGMSTKWNQFRQNYPDRIFYLLHAAGAGHTETNNALSVPPEFLEETDPNQVNMQ